ncbi:MAG: DUF2256 domain-containing protein, partial [Polaromonas sp.]|nr:DUF2256 domain-containing protein [Polaromonas sp.]
NKAELPRKPCSACGREMVWRKSWAKNWESVKYCSEACRSDKHSAAKPRNPIPSPKPRSGPG